MSIKLLHPDARSLLEHRLDSLVQTTARGDQLTALNPTERLVYQVPIDIDATTAELRKVRDAFRSMLDQSNAWAACATTPVAAPHISYDGTASLFGRKITGIIFLYQNAFYAVNGPYSIEEAKLILVDSLRKKKRKAEYLMARKDIPESELEYERQPISEEVRHEVWRRDKGRCVKCGSVHNLEYDHVIPVSLGGANTARNIQLLCEPCNRQKSNNIG